MAALLVLLLEGLALNALSCQHNDLRLNNHLCQERLLGGPVLRAITHHHVHVAEVSLSRPDTRCKAPARSPSLKASATGKPFSHRWSGPATQA